MVKMENDEMKMTFRIKSKKHFEKLLRNSTTCIKFYDKQSGFSKDGDKKIHSPILGDPEVAYQIARIYIDLYEIYLSISCDFDLGNYPYTLFSSSNIDNLPFYWKGFEYLESLGE